MDILLAEDNEANRLLVRSLLEREGHSLDFAENGLRALMRCEDKKYDLILMDILMPVMDGVKALRRLRRSGGINTQTPVFALTGYSSQGDKRRYRQVGFDVVLAKPLKSNVLSQAWESYLKGDTVIHSEHSQTYDIDFDEIDLIDSMVIYQLLQSAPANDIRFIATRFWDSAKSFTALIKKNLALAMKGHPEALSALRRAAHGIKGSAATLGLMRLSRIAATLQNAPPDKIGPLVLVLTHTITPTAQTLEQTILHEDIKVRDITKVKTDFAEAHSGGADAPIKSSQSQPLPSGLPSRHKISMEEAPRRQARAP